MMNTSGGASYRAKGLKPHPQFLPFSFTLSKCSRTGLFAEHFFSEFLKNCNICFFPCPVSNAYLSWKSLCIRIVRIWFYNCTNPRGTAHSVWNCTHKKGTCPGLQESQFSFTVVAFLVGAAWMTPKLRGGRKSASVGERQPVRRLRFPSSTFPIKHCGASATLLCHFLHALGMMPDGGTTCPETQLSSLVGTFAEFPPSYCTNRADLARFFSLRDGFDWNLNFCGRCQTYWCKRRLHWKTMQLFCLCHLYIILKCKTFWSPLV